MKSIKSNEFVLEVITFLFMLMFIYASVSKIIDYQTFKSQIGRSPLIMNYSAVIAWSVPMLEMLIAVMLFMPKTKLLGLFASYFVMYTFTMYILFILFFSPYIPCSCGGILNSLGWTEHLIFNIVFVVLSVVGIVQWNRTSGFKIKNGVLLPSKTT